MSLPRGLHLHLDTPAGIAGDMALGALLDLGVPQAAVRDVLALLPVGGYELRVVRTLRGGLAGTDVKVVVEGHHPHHDHARDDHAHDHAHDDHAHDDHAHDDHAHDDHAHGHAHDDHAHDDHAHDDHAHGHAHDDHAHGHAHDDHAYGHNHDPAPAAAKHARFHAGGHAHRHYRDIRAMLTLLPPDVKALALAMFDRIAVAEAHLHGVAIDDVAFHEVGAVDSIVDLVGTAAAVAYLAPARVTSTPLALGHGEVRAAHGLLPVPAPATLEILRAAGAPSTDGGAAFELTTPTGAAIATALVTTWGPAPAGRVVAVGYGAGDAELPDRPNLLRAVLVEPAAAATSAGAAPGDADTVVEIAANVDDLNPELCEHVGERLFAAGALDVWWQPILMKKGRPALMLGVLAPPAAKDAVVATIFTETTTIGVRSAARARQVLARRLETVTTPYGDVRMKIAFDGDRVLNAAPEHDDCRGLARARGVPLKDVYAAALAAFAARPSGAPR